MTMPKSSGIAILIAVVEPGRLGDSTRFHALQKHKVQEPHLVNLTEVDLLREFFDEGENILLTEAVNVMAVAVVARKNPRQGELMPWLPLGQTLCRYN